MKKFITVISFALMATPAFAADSFKTAFQDNMQIDFLSWCEGDNVMAQTESGQNYVRANCSKEGKVCKVYDAYQMGRVIYSAACE